MDKHRYILASNKVQKLDCTYCGAKKHWQRYIDVETGEVLPEQHGRCDNTDKCGEWVTPKDTGYAKMIHEQERGNRSELENNWKPQRKKATPQPQPEHIFFDYETFKQTLQPERYEKNMFIQNLFYKVRFPFEVDEVTKVIQMYRLGTVSNGYRAGANTFPFIDIKGNVRAIQVKQFDDQNHTIGTDFLHSIIEKHHTRNNKPLPKWLEAYTKQDKRISCLFGEHLLNKYTKSDVYLFEAPKTAVYSTLYFGQPEKSNIICLAVYNKSSFSFDKLQVLQGRFVYVFPDLSKGGITFKEWEAKAKEYESRLPGTRFIFSDLLEQLAPERDKTEGNDLADYLIKQDWRLFRKLNYQQPPQAAKEAILSDLNIRCNNTTNMEKTLSQVTGEAEIWNLIEIQFTSGGFDYRYWLNPGKSEQLIKYDLDCLCQDIANKYGMLCAPEDYYKALRWREADISTHVHNNL